MSFVNIGGDKSDRSYRYKMPVLTTKVEGSGNGVKTVLTNMVDVAKALHVIPQYPVKFFGIELGTQSAFDTTSERAVINGRHSASDLQKILDKFIALFVLCPTCKLPELNVSVSQRSQRIKIDCAACGHNGVLPTTHRLATYIISHPPPKVKRGAHKDSQNTEPAEQDSVLPSTFTKNEKVEWFTDTSDEAVRARRYAEFTETPEQIERANKIDNIMRLAKTTGMTDAPSTILRLYVASKDRTIDEITSELRRLQIARGLDEPQKVKILLEAFIDPTDIKGLSKQFSDHAALFKHFTTTNTDAQLFISCIEDFVGEIHPTLLPRFPLIIHDLYHADVLSEDVLLAWYETSAEGNWLVKKEIGEATRAKTQPFIEWLQQDEEEDEEDEE